MTSDTNSGDSGAIRVYLGLGSNLGNREKNISQALTYLSGKMRVERVSSLYETAPMYYTNQPPFLNAVCRVRTALSPLELLTLVKGIEATLGRLASFPNSPRPIDIDILLYDGVILSTTHLSIPHPRIKERAFVLVPLAEIAPDLVIPGIQQPVAELARVVHGLSDVKRWGYTESRDYVEDAGIIVEPKNGGTDV